MKLARLTLGALLGLMLNAASLAAVAGEPQALSRGEWQKIRKAHAGRPTIVHLWGLTCAPCRVEMPEWGKLVRDNPGVNLITIHAERAPPDPRTVRAMLEDAGLLSVDNWMFDDGFLERLRYEIAPKWRGELPMTLLIDRDGATSTISGPADLAAVRAWLQLQSRSAE